MKIKTHEIRLVTFIVFTLLMGAFAGDLSSAENREFPDWINKLIAEGEIPGVTGPPASLSKCKYKGDVVYYLQQKCCDIQSVLYDESGNRICRPDGGITGGGDGKCTDFDYRKCVLIWKDARSRTPVQNK